MAGGALTRGIVPTVVVDLFNTDPQADPLIGRKLDGRYDVIARLGEGGMGVVYRGRQVHLGRFVAIKVLHQDTAAAADGRRRFQREARALSELAHPNIVPVTDSGIDDGLPFLVMELLQGKTLSELLREGPLPLWRALDIVRQTLRGLAFAHGKGIVHRDLKPANVFLQALSEEDDHVRLLDFGMVKFLERSSSKATADTLTRVGVVVGTPAYMSPEQAKGGPADARTDVYAAGALLFELVAGRRPFVEETAEAVVIAHLTRPVPSLAKVRPGLGASAAMLQPVVERAMAKKPAGRFKDAAAMLVALESVVEKLPAEGGSRRRAETRRRPKPRTAAASGSRSRISGGVITLFLVAAGITVGMYLRTHLRARATLFKHIALPTKAPVKQPAETPRLAEPPPKPAPKPEPPTPTPVQAERPRHDEESGSRARNPWRAPVPRALRAIRDRIEHGGQMSQKGLRPVYEFARQNPDDPRPWLLLGHAYAQLDWLSDSVDRYVRADRVDSTCRGDPQMLADLLRAAAHPGASRVAARAIRDIYGAEAIPALDREMKGRAGEHEAVARLARLRESLPH
jgi:serine/threonine-protein kinase